jgi:hypothetical protein
MKNIWHKILVFLRLRHDGFSTLMYRGKPIVYDNENKTGVLFFNEDGFRFKSINLKKYKGIGRPKKSDYKFSKKPKKL